MMAKTIFVPTNVDEKKLSEQMSHARGSILRKEKQGYILKSPDSLSSPPDRTLTDLPQIISNTYIQYENPGKFRSISCLNDEEF